MATLAKATGIVKLIEDVSDKVGLTEVFKASSKRLIDVLNNPQAFRYHRYLSTHPNIPPNKKATIENQMLNIQSKIKSKIQAAESIKSLQSGAGYGGSYGGASLKKMLRQALSDKPTNISPFKYLELYSTPTTKVYIDKLKHELVFAFALDSIKDFKNLKSHLNSVLKKFKDFSSTLLLSMGGCEDCYRNAYKYVLDSKKPTSLVLIDDSKKGGMCHYTK
jgi:hypothetical protein